MGIKLIYSSSFLSDYGINEPFKLFAFYLSEAVFLHTPCQVLSVSGVAVAALHKLEKNVVVKPSTYAADACVRKYVKSVWLEHTIYLTHCLVRIGIMMKALYAGYNVEAVVIIGQAVGIALYKLSVFDIF